MIAGRIRRKKIARLALLVTGLTGVAAGAQQAAPKPSAVKPVHTLALHLDADQTRGEWTIGALLHKAHGTFKTNVGELIADPKSGVAQGEVEIPTASLTTGDAKRDAKWQTNVLDSARYPAIIFHPTAVKGLKQGDGEQTVTATGTITLHGSDHPVELELHLVVSGHDATVTTHFVVPYVKWGLVNPSSGFTRYDKDIAIDIQAKGKLEEQTAPADTGAGNGSR